MKVLPLKMRQVLQLTGAKGAVRRRTLRGMGSGTTVSDVGVRLNRRSWIGHQQIIKQGLIRFTCGVNSNRHT